MQYNNKFKVVLNNINDIILFSAKCNDFKQEIDICKGRHCIDAKSVVGLIGFGCGTYDVYFNEIPDDEISEKDQCALFRKAINLWVTEK